MGRSPHEPTDQTRQQVRNLTEWGIRQDVICAGLGISKPTLHKYYRDEIDAGEMNAQGQIANRAFQKGVEDGDTTMLIWLSKVRLGWKDASRVIVEGDKDKPLRMEVSARDKLFGGIARLKTDKAD